MPTVPIPFLAKPGQRDTTTTDARFVNVLFEIEKDPVPGAYPVQCIKRPGLSTSTQPFGGAATGKVGTCLFRRMQTIQLDQALVTQVSVRLSFLAALSLAPLLPLSG